MARAALLVGLLMVACAGCSNRPASEPLYPRQGVVTYKGKPAAGVLLTFYQTNSTEKFPLAVQAFTKEDGSFAASTIWPGDGARAGEYIVLLSWRDYHMNAQEERTFTGPDKLGGRYNDYNAPKFRVTIGPSAQEPLKFDLE